MKTMEFKKYNNWNNNTLEGLNNKFEQAEE